MKPKNRMKGDNLALYIIMIILLILALLVGMGQGFELGIKKCNKHYTDFIDDNCYCVVDLNSYQTERVVPTSILNSS